MGLTKPRLGQSQTSTANFDDEIIVLNSSASGTNAKDIGIIFERGDDTNVALIWDESTDTFALINTTEQGGTQGNVTISSYSALKVGSFVASNLAYPTSDGTNGQTMVTDGSGNLSFSSSSSVVDWTADQGSTNIHSGNYTDTNTTYSVGDGGLTQINFTSADNTKLDGIATSANNYVHPSSAGDKHIPTAGASGQFLKYSSSGTAVWAADNNTTYSVGDGGLTQINFTSADNTKLDAIETAATADQTNTEIKTAYEANADTNEFSDAEQTKLSGIATSANNYSLPFSYTSANTANNVVQRDGSGNFVAGTITATCTTAQYADLAENYVSDNIYAVGTVLVFGGVKEVTISNTNEDKRIAGVVSSNSAYLMNSECEGEHIIPIALQGRVPCRVIGVVEKGDIIVSSSVSGAGVAWNETHNPISGSIIGKSLVNKNTNEEELIEVVVGVR